MDISKNLTTIAENVPKVYNAGYIQGNDDGYWDGFEDGYTFGTEESEYKYREGYSKGWDEGFTGGFDEGLRTGIEEGKTAEWSDIWDGIQNVENGTAVWYNFFCSRNRFIVDNGTEQKWVFKPKHDIKPTNSESMFRELNFKRSEGSILYPNLKVDLSQWLKNLGVTLDLSNCGNIANMFYGAYLFTRLPRLDLSACTTMNYVFHYNNIKVIDEIISSETTNWLDTTFGGSFPLEHCIFKGVIAKPFNLSRQSKLDHESLLSVLNCLKDFSGTTTKYTMTFGTTNLAKLTDAEKAIATQKGWTLA